MVCRMERPIVKFVIVQVLCQTSSCCTCVGGVSHANQGWRKQSWLGCQTNLRGVEKGGEFLDGSKVVDLQLGARLTSWKFGEV